MLIYFTHLVNAQFSKVHIFKQSAETPANSKYTIIIRIYSFIDNIKDSRMLNYSNIFVSAVSSTKFCSWKQAVDLHCEAGRSLRSCKVWGFVLGVKGQSQSCAKGRPFLWRKPETERSHVWALRSNKRHEEEERYTQTAIFISLDLRSNHQ